MPHKDPRNRNREKRREQDRVRYQNNRAKRDEQNRAWRQKHSAEYRIWRRGYESAWRAKHPEYQREYRAEHREAFRTYHRKYQLELRAADPERAREIRRHDIKRLADHVVAHYLGSSVKKLPRVLIEAKRAQLLLLRAARET